MPELLKLQEKLEIQIFFRTIACFKRGFQVFVPNGHILGQASLWPASLFVNQRKSSPAQALEPLLAAFFLSPANKLAVKHQEG